MQRAAKLLLVAAIFVALFTNLRWNWTGSALPGQFANFQQDSDALVHKSILLMLKGEGVAHHGGFMVAVHEHHAAEQYNLPEIAGTPADSAYLSQFALQYKAWSLIAFTGKEELKNFRAWTWSIASALMALVLTAFVGLMITRFGFTAGLTCAALLLISNWIVLFGRSPYWVEFTHFLPFVGTWAAYPLLSGSRRGWPALIGLVAGLVCIKALCGYEYITNVVLACTVPALFFEWQAKHSLRPIVLRVAAITVAGGIGFGLAMSAHFVQATIYLKSSRLAWISIVERARSRTEGQSQVEAERLPPKVSVRQIFESYLPIEALGVRDGSETFLTVSVGRLFLLGVALLGIGMLLLMGGFVPQAERSTTQGLLLATAWSGAVSLTWTVLARGHMFIHTHINAITFYLPFFLMVFVLLGFTFRVVTAHLMRRRT